MLTIAVDPGVHHCGLAVFCGSELRAAMLVRNHVEDGGARAWAPMAREVLISLEPYLRDVDGKVLLVVERPQIYQRRVVKADANDLVDLAAVLGAIAAVVRPSEIVERTPSAWKGQTPKKISVQRSQEALRPGEAERVQLERAKSLNHNVWDAVGLGVRELARRGIRERTT